MASSLNKEDGANARIISPLHRNAHLSEEKSIPLFGVGVPPHWRAGRIAWAALRTISPVISSIMRPDIIHETYYTPKPYLHIAARRIVTVFDMIHELYFPGSQTSEYKRASLERCDHVICISHNTKRDLCNLFNFSPERVSVTHLAYENFSQFKNTERAGLTAGKPYFLFVGNRSYYKNFEHFLSAFAASSILKKEFRIIGFGGGTFTTDELSFAAKLGLNSDQIFQLGGNDAVLGAAYAGASAFVYPSLYEGFGIPPLEAMSAGCPVICSNTSSLPEVVGNAALLVNPTDVDALREAMERLAMSSTLRDELIERGHIQHKKFSWQKCAKDTLGVYKSIL
ncbi:MAG: glycosyltransferase family 4 protein [Cohaesibacteraceae bacterium]|nr:glycosyltransferase family 4 protein [Cohaesibacteraceae bacterium]MBL4876521.1 glycosyltransferase family 4 protein [Cohaesibacteraceae bacterium]